MVFNLQIITAALLASYPYLTGAVSLESALSGQQNLTTFTALFKNHSDIFKKLPGGITVVAPNDFAFERLGDDWKKYSQDLVKATLKYHILTESISMTSIERGDSIWASTLLEDADYSTVMGGQHHILTKQPGGEVVFTSGFATRGTVVVEDLAFDGGLVQVIDSVMRVPQTLEETARNAYTDLTSFLGALYAADLIDEVNKLTDVTIFAPRNAAFQQLAGAFEKIDKETLRSILRSLTTAEKQSKIQITRHVNNIYINSAQIIQTDVLISNGVVHLIDNVLNPDRVDAKPNLSTVSQTPIYTLIGATQTGTSVPTPFTSYLPCTDECPVTSSGASATAAPTVAGSSDNAAGYLPRPTGLTGLGVGLPFALGAVIVGL